MKSKNGNVKYWIRVYKYPLSLFGKGESKKNPIRLKSLKQI